MPASPSASFSDRSDAWYEQYFGARRETIERLKGLYQEEYFSDPEMARKREIMQVLEFKNICKHFTIRPGGTVLDIGCGVGDFLLKFEGWTKYGIELSDFARAEAEKKGIITDFELRDGMFDLIIFRGTIQHVPDPIRRIQECYYWLKDGGGIAFLATPNINSLYYKLFNTLPMLQRNANFLLPSDLILDQILENFGFKVVGFEYPYLGTPYARPVSDMVNFILKLLRISPQKKFAFYRNLLECYAIKP
jgi:SAM-dependent methyltransferase